MLPDSFIKRLGTQNYIDSEKLVRALDEPGTPSIRLNPVKWHRKPVNGKPVPWCNDGYYLSERPSFTADPLFHAGCYYSQEASSMFMEEVFNQLCRGIENPKVLDLCGAPGGKSTHLSSMITGNGFLVSNEVIRSRAYVLSENITKWGIPNCIVTNNDPSAFARLTSFFDVIVIDAPCSGEGMFRDKIARSEWSDSNAALCSERQQRILMDAWPSLKSGGILIYSTCTFNPAENEENIKWLTDRTDSESLKINTEAFRDIEEIGYGGVTGYGFHPGKIEGEGFFISALRKTSSEDNTVQSRGKRPATLSSSDVKMAGKLVSCQEDHLYRNDDTIYCLALPAEEFMFIRNHLRVISGGTALFKERNRDIIPLHSLAMSSVLRKETFPGAEMDYEKSLMYLMRENISLENAEKGWMLVSYKGINLGFIKSLGNRTNNYYPSEWRIRMKVSGEHRDRVIKWEE